MNVSRKLLNIVIQDWCRHFKLKYVFTHNTLIRCPAQNPQSSREGRFPKKLIVAAYQDSADISYDCSVAYFKGQAKLVASYGSHIISLLQEVLNFRVTVRGIRSSPPNVTQGLRPIAYAINQSWADISACHLQVSWPTTQRVDYLLPTLTTRQALVELTLAKSGHLSRSLVYNPAKLPLEEDVFVETFTAPLWGCFLAAFVLLILCFRFSTWMHSKVRPDHEPWSWVEVILWAVAAVCQQSYSRYPKGLSCRTTFIIGYLITYLLYTGFAAGVTSLLAVQSQNVNLNLPDVLELKLTLVAAQNTHSPFKANSHNGDLNHNNKFKRIKLEVVQNNKELFRRLRKNNVIGYGYTTSLDQYLRKNVLTTKGYQTSILDDIRYEESLVVRKNFPHQNKINYWLLRMKENGLIHYGKTKYVKTFRNVCCTAVAWSSASLNNVYSAIVILTTGCFISTMILFAEMAWMKKVTGSHWETRAKEDVTRQIKIRKTKPTIGGSY